MAEHCCTCDRPTTRRRPGLVGLIFNLALLYLALVVGGGTLQRVNHPVAVELGRLIHTVTFVEPTIAWADRNQPVLATGLERLSSGLPIG
ncbi:MAG: hypothetical protein ACYTJ0_05005 [Planctomycetota bacterium]|jgi:hypothetical protein